MTENNTIERTSPDAALEIVKEQIDLFGNPYSLDDLPLPCLGEKRFDYEDQYGKLHTGIVKYDGSCWEVIVDDEVLATDPSEYDAVKYAERLIDERSKKERTYEVQWSVKWTNFTIDVRATSEEEAIKLATESFNKNGFKGFTITANREEISSLEDMFCGCDWVRAESF